MVTTEALPDLRRGELGSDALAAFHSLERRFAWQAEAASRLAGLQRVHWVLLVLSVLTVLGAVAGSHGWAFL